MARLTLKAAADRLGVSTKTLRRRIKNGTAHAYLEDGWYYLDTVEVDRLLSKSKGEDIGESTGQEPTQVDQEEKPGKPRQQARKTQLITLDKAEYDALIYRLATLEAEKKLYLKAPPWWKRIFRRR